MVATVIGLFLGAGVAAGFLLVVCGLTGRVVFDDTSVSLSPELLRRIGITVAVGLLVVIASGWPVAGLLAALAAWALPTMIGDFHGQRDLIERTEAIGTWTEQVRDVMSGAAGLEEAITATGPIAPAPIAVEVQRLVARLHHQRLDDALAAFGTEVAHPCADMVVAALVISARMESADMNGALTRLAVSIRGETHMRIRVEVGRAKVRTAASLILGVVAATIVMLTVLSRGYLDAYDGASGQAMLGVVGAIFAGGGALMARMSRIEQPERFTTRQVPR